MNAGVVCEKIGEWNPLLHLTCTRFAPAHVTHFCLEAVSLYCRRFKDYSYLLRDMDTSTFSYFLATNRQHFRELAIKISLISDRVGILCVLNVETILTNNLYPNVTSNHANHHRSWRSRITGASSSEKLNNITVPESEITATRNGAPLH